MEAKEEHPTLYTYTTAYGAPVFFASPTKTDDLRVDGDLRLNIGGHAIATRCVTINFITEGVNPDPEVPFINALFARIDELKASHDQWRRMCEKVTALLNEAAIHRMEVHLP